MKIKNKNKRLKKYAPFLIIILLGAVIIDIFFIATTSDLRFYGAIIIFFFLSRIGKYRSKFTFAFCILLLVILYVKYLLYGPDLATEETAVWLVLFFITGILQQLKE